MYNRQLISDFVFDGANTHYVDWQQVTDSGIISVCMNGRWGLVDRRGNEVIPFTFENLVIIDQNIAFARYNGRYGIINIPQSIVALGGAR